MITTVMTRRKKDSEHYVNNKDFLDAIMDYRKSVEKQFYDMHGRFPVREDRAKIWEGKPRVPPYVGQCFLKIATHLSYKPNFVNYMFREDMICDGVENCLQYIHNFDPEKSTNPFAYFTQIVYFAFLRRIAKEKKQLEIKNKILEQSGFDEVFVSDDNILSGTSSELNSIKNNVKTKMNY